ncbi:MAG TPA: PorT family protein [Caldithrix abyssi]|uniref:PorT family protein n=1 Tax=Caldithrix abyssi TaxID=187145 RepID=A0A7V4U3N5_CALAY|nr:PorT family protein [Caldithrix abyssi]
MGPTVTRKISILLFTLILLTSLLGQEGHLESGVMAGLNMGQFSSKFPGSTSNNRLKTGIIAGGYVQTPLHPQLWMRGELIYTQKGNRIESDSNAGLITTDYLLHYISANITGRYLPVKRLVLYFGPQASYLLSAAWNTSGASGESSGSSTDEFKPLEIGVLGGVAYQVSGNWEIQFRYEFGLSNLFNSELGEQYNLQNRVMSFILAYTFTD